MVYTVSGMPFTAIVNISMIQLPEEPMRPRILDPRMGYFSDRKTVYSTENVLHMSIAGDWNLSRKI